MVEFWRVECLRAEATLEAERADHDEFGQYTRAEALEATLAEAQALALANGMRADAAERRIAKAIDVLLNNDIARCVAEAVAVLRGE